MKQFTEYISAAWMERFVQLRTGIQMAYTVCGPMDGIPVVLLHGVTDGRLAWIRTAPELAKKGLRVYVPEMRGNGRTDKPEAGAQGYQIADHAQDILAFLDALELDAVHLVGHSMGGMVAQELTLSAPHRFRSVTLIDTAAYCRDNPTLNGVLYGDGADFPGLLALEQTGIPEEFCRIWANADLETSDYQAAMLAHVMQIPYHSWIALLTGLIGFNSVGRLPMISGRVQVIWSDGDDLFPDRDQQLLCGGLTGCRLQTVTIHDAGHDVLRDTPDAQAQVTAVIADFILG